MRGIKKIEMNVSRIYRLLRLVTMLQCGRKYTVKQLAEEFEVSRRTIFRDLNMLELARIPYYFDSSDGGYKIDTHFFLPPVNLTLTEALAMLMLSGRLRGTSRMPLQAEATRAAMKLESVLPVSIREHVGSIIDNISVNIGPTSRHEGLEVVFDQITQAIAQKRSCRVVYLSFQQRKQLVFEIDPLKLLFLNRAWYLIGYSHQEEQVRTYKLGRIKTLTMLKGVFEPRAGVDFERPFGEAWSMIPEGRMFDVHLHFEPKVAGNVAEVAWHPSQQTQWNDDGSLEFRVRVDGLGEITWWILGYGDQVEVVSPPQLRAQVASVASSVLGKYGERQ